MLLRPCEWFQQSSAYVRSSNRRVCRFMKGFPWSRRAALQVVMWGKRPANHKKRFESKVISPQQMRSTR